MSAERRAGRSRMAKYGREGDTASTDEIEPARDRLAKQAFFSAIFLKTFFFCGLSILHILEACNRVASMGGRVVTDRRNAPTDTAAWREAARSLARLASEARGRAGAWTAGVIRSVSPLRKPWARWGVDRPSDTLCIATAKPVGAPGRARLLLSPPSPEPRARAWLRLALFQDFLDRDHEAADRHDRAEHPAGDVRLEVGQVGFEIGEVGADFRPQ